MRRPEYSSMCLNIVQQSPEQHKECCIIAQEFLGFSRLLGCNISRLSTPLTAADRYSRRIGSLQYVHIPPDGQACVSPLGNRWSNLDIDP